MSKFCTNCGFEVKYETSNFCTNCGAKISDTYKPKEENAPTVAAENPIEAGSKKETFVSEELIRILCVGKTTLQSRLLIIYNDHIEMLNTDNDTTVFNENYNNITCARRNKSKIFSNIFYLDLKKGEPLKFSLDLHHDLNGKYYSRPEFNTDVNQLSKTLPNYINKLIDDYKKLN